MKCKLLLDENIPPRKTLVRLNSRFNLRHIREDYKKSGIPDREVFEIAEKEGRIIVTFNEKDFAANRRRRSGLIALSPNLTTEEIDTKITSLLTSHKQCHLVGKYIRINKTKRSPFWK
jgi:predicted nuclease of predicted toxin-antitoxin system